MSNLRLALATTALSLALASPALAIPGEAPPEPTYATTFTPQYQVGSYTGILKLTIAPDGTVGGEFRNQDTGSFTPVTGGLEPGHGIHLDFKWIGPVHVVGRFDGNTIVGSTYYGGQVYDFAATPDLTQN
jgi:hypothetical protein